MTRAFKAVVMAELFMGLKSELDANKPWFFPPLKLVHFLHFFVSSILYLCFSCLCTHLFLRWEQTVAPSSSGLHLRHVTQNKVLYYVMKSLESHRDSIGLSGNNCCLHHTPQYSEIY